MATASASCRVLAFEDNYDIGKMLKEVRRRLSWLLSLSLLLFGVSR